MTKYWAIAPWPNNETQIFDQVWEYDRLHGTIAIRWHSLGDMTGLTQREIADRHQEAYGYGSAQAVQMLWAFYNEIELGDVIVARRGRKLCVGRGRVTSPAYFNLRRGWERLNGLGSEYVGTSFIDVKWERLGVVPVEELFAIKTLSNIGEEKYRRLFGDPRP